MAFTAALRDLNKLNTFVRVAQCQSFTKAAAELRTRPSVVSKRMKELGIRVALGAQPETIMGLTGAGDLILTATGDLSRNRRVGLALGRGKKMAEILAEMKQVAEGVKTAKVAHELATKLGVEAPIMDVMYAALHKDLPMREAVEHLLARPVGSERD